MTSTEKNAYAYVRGTDLIWAERQRQVFNEGWSPEHDAKHTGGQLALAAASYALPYEARDGKTGLALLRAHIADELGEHLAAVRAGVAELIAELEQLRAQRQAGLDLADELVAERSTAGAGVIANRIRAALGAG